MRYFCTFFLVLSICHCLAQSNKGIKYIETHVHLKGTYKVHGQIVTDWDAAAHNIIQQMEELGIYKCFIMPPPQGLTNTNTYDYKGLAKVCKKYPHRLFFQAGGGTLNYMIQEAVKVGNVTEKMRKEFRRTAEEIASSDAVGYGEMTAEHFSFNDHHPYINAPPDHELFLLLADISAKNGLPIDLHMEAIEHNAILTERLKSPPNPKQLTPNIDAFERLLKHNRKAKIIWQHVGWDNTGQMTIELVRRLLAEHPNLYLGLKCLQKGISTPANRPLKDDQLKKEWSALILAFPDRFVLGSDYFFGIPGKTRPMPDSSKESRYIVNQLPESVQSKVAYENAEKIFGLGTVNR